MTVIIPGSICGHLIVLCYIMLSCLVNSECYRHPAATTTAAAAAAADDDDAYVAAAAAAAAIVFLHCTWVCALCR